MEIMGQVFGVDRISKYIKASKEKREAEEKHQQEFEFFTLAKDEINTIKSNMDCLCDTSAIEASIYRLKEAELDFNRYLKDKKHKKTS